MDRLKIMLDMDGVLANFLYGYNQIQKTLGKELTPHEAEWDAFWDDDVWAVIKSSPNYWIDLPCLLNPIEMQGLRELERRHDVYFCTARLGVKPKQQTELWLASRGVYCPTVLVTADGKGGANMKLAISYGVGAQFSIDDRLKNVEMIARNERCISYLLTTPQNAPEHYLPRIESFHRFLEHIESEENK